MANLALTIQAFLNGHWQDIAKLEFNDAKKVTELIYLDGSKSSEPTARQLLTLKSRLAERGVPERILTFPAIGFDSLPIKLKEWQLL